MSKSTVPRRARRRFPAALAIPFAIAPSTDDPDADILALSAEVARMSEIASEFGAARIEPFEEEFQRLICDESHEWEVRRADAAAWGRKTGRDAAIAELKDIDEETDRLFYGMMSIPATTQPGRAAKVRALLVHVMREEWRGEAKKLDWDIEQARALLGEFAGMTAEDLTNV